MPPTGGGAGRGPQQAAEHADRRGLAGAVAAEEAEDLAGADVERHVVDGDEAAESAREVPDFDRVHRPIALSSCASDSRTPARARVPIELRLQQRVLGVEDFDLRDHAGPVSLANDAAGFGGRRDAARRQPPPRRGRTRSRARADAPRPRARNRTRRVAAVDARDAARACATSAAVRPPSHSDQLTLTPTSHESSQRSARGKMRGFGRA